MNIFLTILYIIGWVLCAIMYASVFEMQLRSKYPLTHQNYSESRGTNEFTAILWGLFWVVTLPLCVLWVIYDTGRHKLVNFMTVATERAKKKEGK